MFGTFANKSISVVVLDTVLPSPRVDLEECCPEDPAAMPGASNAVSPDSSSSGPRPARRLEPLSVASRSKSPGVSPGDDGYITIPGGDSLAPSPVAAEAAASGWDDESKRTSVEADIDQLIAENQSTVDQDDVVIDGAGSSTDRPFKSISARFADE